MPLPSTAPVELHGVEIPAAARVLLLTGSAHRDETVSANPTPSISTATPVPPSPSVLADITASGNLAQVELRVALEEIVAALAWSTGA
ncbi:hypothetical protein [Nocardia sp. A7]|uniref:hypothetical protein n=1 Tax=Nocardia sp. A7 TaxID=2789274 RepID=UPI00397A2121